MKDSVVKIDGELEKKIEELIEKERFLYKSKKQVVDLAILEFLKSRRLNLSEKRSKKRNG